MEKGQLCYAIMGNNTIEPVNFIEENSSHKVSVKSLDNERTYWIDSCYVCNTKEEAYKKLLSWLESDKQEAEEAIEDLENELDVINEANRKLKQKYEI